MAESKKYFQKQQLTVKRGDWVEITTTKKRKIKGKVLSASCGGTVIENGKVLGYQYELEISREDGEGYGLSWKQWLEPGQGGTPTDGGTFRKVKAPK